jgi:hypothetical protein
MFRTCPAGSRAIVASGRLAALRTRRQAHAGARDAAPLPPCIGNGAARSE